MARTNIQMKGIRRSPSGITGVDGDLHECVNLVPDNGELRPIELPEPTGIQKPYTCETLAAVHDVAAGRMFVFAGTLNGDTVVHVKDGNNEMVQISGSQMLTISGESARLVETVGNTIVIGTDKGTHYMLYKNGEYRYLGDRIPQPVFDFNLSLSSGAQLEHNIFDGNPPCVDMNGDVIAGGGIPLDYQNDLAAVTGSHYVSLENTDSENKKEIAENFKSKMEMMHGEARRNNRFVYPFFVRYAVRMFDNTHVMHSAPLLMIPSTQTCPVLALVDVFRDATVDTSPMPGGYNDHHMAVGNIIIKMLSQGLTYRCNGFIDKHGNQMPKDAVEEWGDVIKGVDVYLSSQVQSYNPQYYDDRNNIPTKFYHNPISIDYGNRYASTSEVPWYSIYFGGGTPYVDINDTFNMGNGTGQYGGDIYRHHIFPIPSYSAEYIREKIEGTSLFYRVKSYDTATVSSQWSSYRMFHDEVEYGTLDNLETYRTLDDDYVSRCSVSGTESYSYNSRMVLGNISLEAPLWYPVTEWEQNGFSMKICFVIEKPGRTIYVRSDNTDGHVSLYRFGHYIYYPDTDCKKAIVSLSCNGISAGTYVIPMSEHYGLNGSYALMPGLMSMFDAVSDGTTGIETYTSAFPLGSSDRYYSLPSTIMMSDVSNPFHFSATNFRDIGRAEVIGIAANTMAVSSGQWGQYPLYVFCSDGIVAVQIDDHGNLGGTSAVSSDVLLKPRGMSMPTMVQTGQAIVFITMRGVMAISGTSIKCLSEPMDGPHFNAVAELGDVCIQEGGFDSIIQKTSDGVPFRDFASAGFLAYDYAHGRLLVINGYLDYQYALDTASGMWSKMLPYEGQSHMQEYDPYSQNGSVRTPVTVRRMCGSVNGYSEMYLIDEDGYVHRTMDVEEENSGKAGYRYGYFVTRPVRFGTDEFKTITRLLHRYTRNGQKSCAKMQMYGSRDGIRYARINTLRGMSWQYYIFVIYTCMKPNDRYSYLTADTDIRLADKLR